MNSFQIAKELGYLEGHGLTHEELFALWDAKPLNPETYEQVKNPFK